jgi:hypothetical protein
MSSATSGRSALYFHDTGLAAWLLGVTDPFQDEWLRGLHTWRRHAERAERGQGLLVCGVPGHFEHQGVVVSNWRDALLGLVTPAGQG